MRIEKINDNKLKILLTNDDLKERNIKMAELAFGSEKTRDLFKEMISIAADEYDFYADDSQLMIEAIPISLEAIVIMVTKMDEEEKIVMHTKKKKSKDAPFVRAVENMSIYEFNTLDDVCLVTKVLYARFGGESVLVKKDKKYFLILNNNAGDEITDEELEIIIGEYGKKRVVNPISKAYLFEHGEVIIKENAIDVLSEYL